MQLAHYRQPEVLVTTSDVVKVQSQLLSGDFVLSLRLSSKICHDDVFPLLVDEQQMENGKERDESIELFKLELFPLKRMSHKSVYY